MMKKMMLVILIATLFLSSLPESQQTVQAAPLNTALADVAVGQTVWLGGYQWTTIGGGRLLLRSNIGNTCSNYLTTSYCSSPFTPGPVLMNTFWNSLGDQAWIAGPQFSYEGPARAFVLTFLEWGGIKTVAGVDNGANWWLDPAGSGCTTVYVIGGGGTQCNWGGNNVGLRPAIYTTGNLYVSNGVVTDSAGDLITGINEARQAAEAAKLAALDAKNAALAAAADINYVKNTQLVLVDGSVRDATSTALLEARAAKENAINATNAANNAATIAQNAVNAGNNATNAANNAATNAQNAYNAILSTNTNLGNAITNSTNTITSSLNNLESSVTNNFNNLQSHLPPTLTKVMGYQSASATTTSEFRVTLDYSNATECRYKIDNGTWSSWIPVSIHDAQGYIVTSGIGSVGSHTVYVELKNGTVSTTAKGSKTFFRVNP